MLSNQMRDPRDPNATALTVIEQLARELDAGRALISCDPPTDTTTRHAVSSALHDARAAVADALDAVKAVAL